MERWQERLNADPLPWLLEDHNPAVRRVCRERQASPALGGR